MRTELDLVKEWTLSAIGAPFIVQLGCHFELTILAEIQR